ncbi:MAG: hypothetical protein RXN77_01615 [Sulfolobaceae archaeon]|nr:hypothetical protein [Sulfolobales archaeon]
MELQKIAVIFVLGALLAGSLGLLAYVMSTNEMVKHWLVGVSVKKMGLEREESSNGTISALTTINVVNSTLSAPFALTATASSSQNTSQVNTYYRGPVNVTIIYNTASIAGTWGFVFYEIEWEGTINVSGSSLTFTKSVVVYPEQGERNWKDLLWNAREVTFMMVPQHARILLDVEVPEGSKITAFTIPGLLTLEGYNLTESGGEAQAILFYQTGEVNTNTIVVLPVMINDAYWYVYVIEVSP